MTDEPVEGTPENPDKTQEEPMIQLDGKWVPAHEAWAKMEVASEVADVIERFNRRFPELSSDSTRDVVPLVRQRLKDIQLRMPQKSPESPDLGPIAFDLLQRMSPEEAIESLGRDFDQSLGLRDLIALAGEAAYLGALAREAEEYRVNAILPEQTAQIWNEMRRPAPGGGLWSAAKVEAIMAEIQSS